MDYTEALKKIIDDAVEERDFRSLHRLFSDEKIFELGLAQVRFDVLDGYMTYTLRCYLLDNCQNCLRNLLAIIDNFIEQEDFKYLLNFANTQGKLATSQWLNAKEKFCELICQVLQNYDQEVSSKFLREQIKFETNFVIEMFEKTLINLPETEKRAKIQAKRKKLEKTMEQIYTDFLTGYKNEN